MTSQRQQTRANKMLTMIQKHGIINKFDLMDLCEMSVGDYNQIVGWFKHRYQDTNQMVEYDKASKNWKWIQRIPVNELKSEEPIAAN